MSVTLLALIVVNAVVLIALTFYVVKFGHKHTPSNGSKNQVKVGQDPRQLALEEVDGLFNKDFKEELRNIGRLKFESIMADNSTDLKKNLDESLVQMDQYARNKVDSMLNEQISVYAKSLSEAQGQLVSSLQNISGELEKQRQAVSESLTKSLTDREMALLASYEKNMSKIIEHYLHEALGEQFDLKTQLPFIITQMEANKRAMLEDMKL